jgi:hypothetical protein
VLRSRTNKCTERNYSTNEREGGGGKEDMIIDLPMANKSERLGAMRISLIDLFSRTSRSRWVVRVYIADRSARLSSHYSPRTWMKIRERKRE